MYIIYLTLELGMLHTCTLIDTRQHAQSHLSSLHCSAAVVTLTYEVLGRPGAVRPIPGETVVFTCEVETETLTWINEAFQSNTISFIRVINPPRDRVTDLNTGA